MVDLKDTTVAPRFPALSFVIPVRNDANGLAICLESIRRAADRAQAPVECIVVDNGSTDGSPNVARRHGCKLLIVPGEPVGALRNRGAEAAQAPLLAFVDADHELDADWVAVALRWAATHARAAAGTACVSPPTGTWVQAAYDALREHVEDTREVDWLGSGNLVVDRDLFTRIGGFDTALIACEDVDLCRRIRNAGGRIWNEPGLISIHHGDPRTLRDLFRSELWRGRNNLQVTLRGDLSLRDLPSVLIPIYVLALAIGVLVALATLRLTLAAFAVLLLTLPSLLRALRMNRRGLPWRSAVPVALTYDAARALALITRAEHRRAVASTPAPAK